MTRQREGRTVNRRRYLGAVGSAMTLGLAGCSGLIENRSPYAPPVVENRPDAVYHPSHVEGMEMIGMATDGPYGCALTYTYPHRFWLVTGKRTERVSIRSTDSIHLMATVWDRETGTVLPDASPQIDVSVADESITSFAPWPMLSQPMGVHYGDNVELPGEGSYTVSLDIAPTSLTPSSAMSTGLEEAGSCTFEFDYDRATRDEISVTNFPEKKGSRAALPSMKMGMMPTSQAPAVDALPGSVIGTATTGDAKIVATVLDDATRFGGGTDQQYLAISPRTPYNRHVIPFMSIAGSVTQSGSTIFDDRFSPSVDEDFGVHYGAVVDEWGNSGTLDIDIETPPQIARHEGYERAFLEMPGVSISL